MSKHIFEPRFLEAEVLRSERSTSELAGPGDKLFYLLKKVKDFKTRKKIIKCNNGQQPKSAESAIFSLST